MTRVCKNCEYSRKSSRWTELRCHLNPPVISVERSEGRFPTVAKKDFCSKWEPKWDENPVIAEAWQLFQATLKLAK